jgi:hypothetical protein
LELSSALKGMDTYGLQYFADFSGAVQSALSARASGACSARASAPRAQIPPAGNQPSSLPTTSVTTPSDAGIPLPILLMGILAVGLALLAAASTAVRMWASDDGLVAGWRHAWAEAGYRAGEVWADFRDWLRSA